MTQRRQLQRRQHPIPAEAMGGSEDVTGLLTAQGCAIGHHCGMDMLVANGRALQHTAATLPGPFKSEVGHHGGDQTIARQGLLVLEDRSPEIKHVIAIHHPTLGIHRQHPVRVAVEGEAHDSPLGHHRLAKRVQLG